VFGVLRQQELFGIAIKVKISPKNIFKTTIYGEILPRKGQSIVTAEDDVPQRGVGGVGPRVFRRQLGPVMFRVLPRA
jgi:hypothetical protein